MKLFALSLVMATLFAVIVYKSSFSNSKSVSIIPTPVSTPIPFTKYEVPIIPKKSGYTIVFVGDSMTSALGPHPSRLSDLLNKAYGPETFAIDNYSQPSQSIRSLDTIMKSVRNIDGLEVEPIMDRDVDLIIIESFGHNPLSELPLDEGLRKQEEILNQTMGELIQKHPQAIVIFLATIGPDEATYAKKTLDLSLAQRAGFAKERKMYIENFIRYAAAHQIPLVNVYQKSQNADGSVKPGLISKNDNIHPSQDGIEFIQAELVTFILEHNYLPH